MTTPRNIRAEVTTTGLSPEFHFADLRIGRAGSFCRPALDPPFLPSSQSVNSHRSKSRPSLSAASAEFDCILASTPSEISSAEFDCILVSTPSGLSSLKLVSVLLVVVAAPSSRPSRYCFTSPLDLDMANFVREIGTTELFHTRAAMTQRTTTPPIATKPDVSGITGSNTCTLASAVTSAALVNAWPCERWRDDVEGILVSDRLASVKWL